MQLKKHFDKGKKIYFYFKISIMVSHGDELPRMTNNCDPRNYKNAMQKTKKLFDF